MRVIFFYFLLAISVFISSCREREVEPDTVVEENVPPEVIRPFSNQAVTLADSEYYINLGLSIVDQNSFDTLKFYAVSSAVDVASVIVKGEDLLISINDIGVTNISITATDIAGESVSDQFDFFVGVIPCENILSKQLLSCDRDNKADTFDTIYNESIENERRKMVSNSVPNHPYGKFNGSMDEKLFTYYVNTNPSKIGVTHIVGENSIEYHFGIASNGVRMSASLPEAFRNVKHGERNWNWVYESTNNTHLFRLDCNKATNRNLKYSYYGDFHGYASLLGINGEKMVQVGWAADGFPIYYKYAYTDENDVTSPVIEMKSSYQLKLGERPGDGIASPCGKYSGIFHQDYEYINELGDLDECNGRTGITPEFPNGTYYYLVTSDYPFIPKCFSGAPHESFRING